MRQMTANGALRMTVVLRAVLQVGEANPIRHFTPSESAAESCSISKWLRRSSPVASERCESTLVAGLHRRGAVTLAGHAGDRRIEGRGEFRAIPWGEGGRPAGDLAHRAQIRSDLAGGQRVADPV